MSTNVITLFEDKKQNVLLTARQNYGLCKLKEIIGQQNVTVQTDGFVQVQHYVGFYANSDVKLQILPKVIQDEAVESDHDTQSLAIYLLFKLLSESGYINVKQLPELKNISEYGNDIFEILISLYTKELQKLLRSHILKSYEPKTDNLQMIKGKIVMSETVLRNSFKPHYHFVRFDEFTQENLINMILKTTASKMWQIARIEQNRKVLREILLQMEDIPPININKDVFEKIVFNRLNNSYEWVFKLARMFYHNVNPGIYSGNTESFSFLIKLNELYEYFLYKQIDSKYKDFFGEDCYVTYQKPEKKLNCNDNKTAITLRPDIVVSGSDKKTVAIIDAKYKDIQYGVTNADIYQMLAYSIRYECNQIYLIYPRFYQAKPCMDFYEIKNGDKTISIKIRDFDLFNDEYTLSL